MTYEILYRMSLHDKIFSLTEEIEAKLGIQFHNKTLLIQAFIHRSYLNENRTLALDHNERLECLGDTVFNLIITEYLYQKFPTATEGELSSKRATLIDADSCYHYLRFLKLESFPLLGKGEERNTGKGRETILADLFEAVIGAIFLDRGFDTTRTFLFDHFGKIFESTLQNPSQNYKAILQDHTQKTLGIQPEYRLEKEEGPDHDKQFTIAVFLKEKKWGEGKGSSKKIAEQEAAKNALENVL